MTQTSSRPVGRPALTDEQLVESLTERYWASMNLKGVKDRSQCWTADKRRLNSRGKQLSMTYVAYSVYTGLWQPEPEKIEFVRTCRTPNCMNGSHIVDASTGTWVGTDQRTGEKVNAVHWHPCPTCNGSGKQYIDTMVTGVVK
jgi:hypothetical protein